MKATANLMQQQRESTVLGSIVDKWPPWVPTWVYAAMLCITAFVMRFGVLSNDTFPLLTWASYLSASNPESLYNGFFPIGFGLVLKVLLLAGASSANILGILLSAGASVFALYLTSTRLPDRETILPKLVAVIPFLVPSVIRASLSTTPDALAMLGVACMMSALLRPRGPAWIIAGVSLGAAFLFRGHLAALGVAMLVVLLLDPTYRKGALRFALGFIPFVMLQGALQVYAGHGFFESSQAFNVWKAVHGVDWSHPPVVTESVASIVTSPGFIRSWLGQLVQDSPWIVLLILGWIIARRSARSMLSGVMISALIFILVSAIGKSDRALIAITPIFALALWEICNAIGLRAQNRILIWVGATLYIAAAVFTVWSGRAVSTRLATYDTLASELKIDRTSAEVLTDDFALYFPSHENKLPHVIGGWLRVGLPYASRMIPEVRDSTIETLNESISAAHITHFVLLQPPVNTRLAALVQRDTAHFQRMQTRTAYAVYTVK